MTLRQKQSLFVELVAYLFTWTYQNGYELTLAEAYRTPEQARRNAAAGTGIASSLHCQRLAIDLNLFRDGAYMTSTEAHMPLGTYWKSLDSLCRWGGDFRRRDGNHYSLAHGGRA